ncbi:MAG: hypothetical protein ACO1OQ_09595 [Rufibacter sp.]
MNKIVKSSSFGEEERELLITEEIIHFDGKQIVRNDISDLLYWVSTVEFYRFPVGRKFYIGFKTPDSQLDIVFKSYFGISNGYFLELCNQILEEMWEPVIEQIWNRNAEELAKGGSVRCGHCQISERGILISKGSLVATNERLITWEDLYYEKKYDRLVINSKSDQHLWTNLYFKDNWNIDIFMATLDWIVKENGLAEMQN